MTRKRLRARNRGSALLVTLMVMVGLSLLGLGFVTISETESAISVNERNYAQTLQVAEAGVKVVAEWFNAPDWALDNGLLPQNTSANETAFKREREVGSYVGKYRPSAAGGILFDYPLRGDEEDKLFGIDAENADFVIDNSTTEGATFLTQFNGYLLADTTTGGLITEIRIYAPPVVNGTTATHNGYDFWQTGTRYGVATIAVTAENKFAGKTVAKRTVRAVVAEFPFPGPDGPLQSNAGIALGGAFRVHWGKVISLNDLYNKRNHIALPWLDAWTPIQYEYGYADSYYDSSDPTSYPLYLDELIGKSFEDPWFEVRARDELTSSGVPITDVQPWDYSSVDDDETAAGVAGYSGQFQDQDEDDQPNNKKEVIFIRPVYKVWKQIALTGATQQGIYYLRYNSGTGEWYDVRGKSKSFADWVNVKDQGNEGFFFFDTLTAADPQNPDGTTDTSILTPDINLSASDGNPFLMRGFIYMNAEEFGTQGIGNELSYYNSPGEPFRDIGVHVVAGGKLQCADPADSSVKIDCSSDPTADPWFENYTNYRWDYQDLDADGQFDYFVDAKTWSPPGTDSGAVASACQYSIVPYFDGCTPGADCSEPHEPYLNLVFGSTTAKAIASGTNPQKWKVCWENPSSQSRMAKDTTDGTSTGTLISCNSSSSTEDCTSNAYDELGPMLALGGNVNDNPVLDGVLYNEGNYDSQGAAIYYGSILIWGTVDGTGNPDVWYDYKLSSGDWQERFENLPRTIMTSLETDQ